MSLLKEIWERLFHWSNITHIANAHRDDIWVSFHSKNLNLDGAEIELAFRQRQPSAEINLKLNQASNTSWFKITSGCFHRYNRRAKTEKITILRDVSTDQVDEAAGKRIGKILVVNYLVHQNFSYIVTKTGDLLQQKYGSNNLFQDFSGWCHLKGQQDLSTSRTSYTCVYVSVFLGTALSFCVFRHRITGSFSFQSLREKMKRM